jgi:hypothetical protein
MELTDRQLDEFIALYKRYYGHGLRGETAREMATRVVSLYLLLLDAPAGEGSTTPPDAAPPHAPSPSAPAS